MKCPGCGIERRDLEGKCGICGYTQQGQINSQQSVPTISTDDAEQEIWSIQPTAKTFLGQIIWGVITIPILVGIGLLLNAWYKTAALRYRLTTQRLFVTTGLIAKHEEEVELYRIKDVTVRQGLLQRVMGIGTITVLSTDDSNPRIQLFGVNRPMDVKETLRTHYRAARKREGIRSAEFIAS